jgi:hypothetical protein
MIYHYKERGKSGINSKRKREIDKRRKKTIRSNKKRIKNE